MAAPHRRYDIAVLRYHHHPWRRCLRTPKFVDQGVEGSCETLDTVGRREGVGLMDIIVVANKQASLSIDNRRAGSLVSYRHIISTESRLICMYVTWRPFSDLTRSESVTARSPATIVSHPTRYKTRTDALCIVPSDGTEMCSVWRVILFALRMPLPSSDLIGTRG